MSNRSYQVSGGGQAAGVNSGSAKKHLDTRSRLFGDEDVPHRGRTHYQAKSSIFAPDDDSAPAYSPRQRHVNAPNRRFNPITGEPYPESAPGAQIKSNGVNGGLNRDIPDMGTSAKQQQNGNGLEPSIKTNGSGLQIASPVTPVSPGGSVADSETQSVVSSSNSTPRENVDEPKFTNRGRSRQPPGGKSSIFF